MRRMRECEEMVKVWGGIYRGKWLHRFLPTTTIILPLNRVNSNLLNTNSQAVIRKFYCFIQKIKFLLVWFRWWYLSAKRIRSSLWHFNTFVWTKLTRIQSFEWNNNTSGWILGNYRLISLNYPIQRKIIVVVGRCSPYLIMIFWRNQTVDYIFSWSQQRYPHIDPLEHVVLPKHVLHVFVVR